MLLNRIGDPLYNPSASPDKRACAVVEALPADYHVSIAPRHAKEPLRYSLGPYHEPNDRVRQRLHDRIGIAIYRRGLAILAPRESLNR